MADSSARPTSGRAPPRVIEPDRIYDVTELGVLLGKQKQSIFNDRYSGRPSPPAIRIGRKLRYRGADVLAWMEAHRER